MVGEWAIRDTVFEMPSGVPMRLTNAKAENIYRNHAFFLTQSYAIPLQRVTENDFSLADLSAVFIGHSIEYDIWSKTYTDIFGTYTDERGSKDENGNFVATEGHEYYDNWFIHPDASRDTLCERRLSNRLFVQAQPWDRNGVIGTIDGGVGFDIHTYCSSRSATTSPANTAARERPAISPTGRSPAKSRNTSTGTPT